MSDFDREAEREKLREKFERDERKREATEQMSKLLLQGATMTNRHCPECHSPVFRYEGKEFCPTCQREVTEQGELADGAAPDDEQPADAGADAATGGADAATGGVDAASNGSDATADGANATTDVAAGSAADHEQEPVPDSGTADRAGEPQQPSSGAAPESDRQPTDVERPAETGAEPTPETRPATTDDRRPARVDPPARRDVPAPDGEFGDAESTLVDEIERLTRRAEETRDVQRERDLLAAAREAAETLRTLRRI